MFVIVFISCFRATHAPLFLKMDSDDEGLEELDPDKIGYLSCVTMFIRMLLSLVRLVIESDHLMVPPLSYLTVMCDS